MINKFVRRLAMFALICSTLSAVATAADTIKVKSYTKKDGTVVQGYTRTKTSKDEGDVTKVKGYTKADGTKVAGYTRKKKVTGDGTVEVKEKAKVKDDSGNTKVKTKTTVK